MTAQSPLWLICNSASGSNGEASLAALQAALAEAGCEPARTIDCAEEDLPDRAALEEEGVACVAIFTGDGTVSALVPALEGWGGAVLVLPGGTANLLAKTLHGDRTAVAIVTVFGAGQLQTVQRQCLRFPGHVALIEVLAGPGATWSDVREGLREGDLAEVASKTVEAVRESADGSRVAVVDPALGRADGYAGVRLVPQPGGIVADGYVSETLGDYFKQGIALLKRDFREGPHDELGQHRVLTCRSVDGAPIQLMIDGERESGPAELRFALATLAVNLLACSDD